jgi:ATP-dependent protease ClpP protease subunit
VATWTEILKEIGREAQRGRTQSLTAQDTVRRRYLKRLHKFTGRNIIAYYSGFLSKPGIAGADITDEDKNGFMMAIHKLDRKLGLDLVLHTPGGNIAVTESLVDYLKRMFKKDIRAIVPQIAMSAGTMIACACREIVMGKHSNLGPIDPQILGIPAAGVIEEFNRAFAEITADNAKLNVWQFILRQYTPSYLGQCENAVDWAKNFVRSELTNNMLAGEKEKQKLASVIVDQLTDFSKNKAHDRHINIDECRAIGLVIKSLEDDFPPEFQNLVLSVHHSYMHALSNTQSFKIIENHLGAAYVKQQMMMQVAQAVNPGP